MQDNLKDILANLNTEIDQETLLLYLQDKLPASKKHDVERKLSASEFEHDALEGLQQFDDKKKITHLVEMLNRDLKKKVARKTRRREKLRLKDQPWLIFAVVIFLLLIVLCYMIIHRMIQAQ